MHNDQAPDRRSGICRKHETTTVRMHCIHGVVLKIAEHLPYLAFESTFPKRPTDRRETSYFLRQLVPGSMSAPSAGSADWSVSDWRGVKFGGSEEPCPHKFLDNELSRSKSRVLPSAGSPESACRFKDWVRDRFPAATVPTVTACLKRQVHYSQSCTGTVRTPS
jgi:hypothetical protein